MLVVVDVVEDSYELSYFRFFGTFNAICVAGFDCVCFDELFLCECSFSSSVSERFVGNSVHFRHRSRNLV